MPTITIQSQSSWEDTYTSSEIPTGNFGDRTELSLGKIGSSASNIYIKPNISQIPQGAEIVSATLYVFANGVFFPNGYPVLDGVFSVRHHTITSKWTEGNVTHLSTPSVANIGSVLWDTDVWFKSVDVTQQIKAQMNGTGFGIFLNGPSDMWARIYSSESSNNPPYLTVSYNMPPTIPTVVKPNGGETWDNQHTITWQPSTDVESIQSSLRYKIQLSTNNGGSWKNIVALTSQGAISYDYNFINEPSTSTARIRICAYDGTSYGEWNESNGVFTINHNVAPTMPTNLTPSGSIIDRLKTQPFTWRHNDDDMQSKAVIEWRPQGSTTWTTYTSNGAEQVYFIAANTLPTGQIEWRVRTYDQQGLVSPYSAIAVVSSAEPTSAPTILMPADVVNIARPVVKWAGGAQASYQIVIEDSLGAPVWDTGEITSTNKAVTVGVDLLNGGTYTIRVRIKDASGLFSTFVDKTVVISYTPPVKPELTAFTADGFIAFNIVAPTPTGTQPNVESHEIYKRINDEWVRVAFGVGSTYNDYHVKSGVTYEYYAKAIGANGAVSNSDIVAQSTTFRGSWIHAIQDAEATLQYFRYNGIGYVTAYEPEAVAMKFAGRTRPVVHFGAYEDYSLTVRIQAVEGMSDMDALKRFVRERETVCYRDADGNLIVGHILALNVEKEYRVSNATITIIESDFNEEV